MTIAVSLLPRVMDSSELGRSVWRARRVPRGFFATSPRRSDARAPRCGGGALNGDPLFSARGFEEVRRGPSVSGGAICRNFLTPRRRSGLTRDAANLDYVAA